MVALTPAGSLASEAPAEDDAVLSISPSPRPRAQRTLSPCARQHRSLVSQRRKLRPRMVEGLLGQEGEVGRPDLKLGVLLS